MSKLTQVFARNGYPKSFVRASVHRVLHNQPRINDQEDWIYMKLPYINEEFKRRSLAVVRRSGLDNPFSKLEVVITEVCPTERNNELL